MNTLTVVFATILALFVLSGAAKHTLHVDNVYPNFGETVLISGPFRSDRLDPDVLNVGEFNINSEEGLNITTTAGISFSGSSIGTVNNSTNVYVNATSGNSTVSIVAASTVNLSGRDVVFGTDGQLDVSALGGFQLITGGLFNLSAGAVNLSGDYLTVVSGVGSIRTVSGGDLRSGSPALGIESATDIQFNATLLGEFSALQSLEAFTSKASLTAASLNIVAERNNILVDANAGMSLTGRDFNVNTKGGAILSSVDGDLTFVTQGDLSVVASDDIQLNAADTVLVELSGNAYIRASNGNTYLLADRGSLNEFNQGSFIANNTFRGFSLRTDLETTQGDLEFSVSAGTFTSSSVNFQKYVAVQDAMFSAEEQFIFDGTEQVTFLAERGAIYFTPSGDGDSPSDVPINFSVQDYAKFRGDNANIVVNFLDINTGSTRFATADASLSSYNGWTVSKDVVFDLTDDFYYGSSEGRIFANGDLSLTSNGDNIEFEATFQIGAGIFIDSSSQVTDTTTEDVIFNSDRNIDWSVQTSLSWTSVKDTTLAADHDIRVLSEDVFTASANSALFTTRWNSAYETTSFAPQTYKSTDQTILSAGSFDVQALNSVEFNSDVFNVERSTNIELNAKTGFDINTDTISVNASRYVVINGDQQFTGKSVILDGNTFFGSPQGQDITFKVAGDFNSNGNAFSLGGDLLTLDIADQTQFKASNIFNISTGPEGLIRFTGASLTENSDDSILFSTDGLSFDNQFTFAADGSLNINQNSANSTAIFSADQFTQSAPTSTYNADSEADIIAGRLDVETDNSLTFTSTNTSFSTRNSLSFYSNQADITIPAPADPADQDLAVTFNSQQIFTYAGRVWTAQGRDGDETFTINADDQFSFTGGNLNSKTSGDTNFTADSINLFGFNSITEVSLTDLNIIAETQLNIESAIVRFLTDEDLIIDGSTLSGTASQNNSVTINAAVASQAESVFTAAGDLYYQSNDELYILSDSTWTQTVTAPDANGNAITLTSTAGNGGILFQIGSGYDSTGANLFSANINGDVSFTASFDDLPSLLEVRSDLATFSSEKAIYLTAEFPEYDDHLDQFISILHRTVNGPISIASTENSGKYNSIQNMRLQTAEGIILHNALGNITIDTLEGLIVNAAREFDIITDNGDLLVSLESFSRWQASSEINTQSECNLQYTSGGNADLLTDQGEINFIYRGNEQMRFTSASFNAEGADAYSWVVQDRISATGGSILLQAASSLNVDSDGTAEQGFDITSARNSVYRSSFNNDISFSSADLSLIAGGYVSHTALDDVLWRGKNGQNTFTGSAITSITSGSIEALLQGDAVFDANSDFKLTALNQVGFEAVNTVQVGTRGTSIITFNTGGDTLDNGVFIDALNDIRYITDANLNVASNGFFSQSTGGSSWISDRTAIESQGTDAIGKDVYFESASSLGLVGENTINQIGSAVRYEYDSTLAFQGDSVRVDSTTFFELDADLRMGIDVSGFWNLRSNTLVYTSQDDSTWIAGSDVTFSTTQTISGSANEDTLFEGDNGVLFQTALGNSPIIFETQDPSAGFYVQTDLDYGVKATSKVTLTATRGYNAVAFGPITFSAKDEFSVDTNGMVEVRSRSSDISIEGTDPSGAGSRLFFTSTGSLFERVEDTIDLNAGGELSFIPDHDLTFHLMAAADFNDGGSNFAINVGDDIEAQIGGNFTFSSEVATLYGGTFRYQTEGANVEDEFAIRFSTEVFSASALAGSMYWTATEEIHLEANQLSVEALGSQKYTATNNIVFNTTEFPLEVQLSAGNALNLTGSDVTLAAVGTDPHSGAVFINAEDSNTAADTPYGVRFLSNNNIIGSIEQAKFIMEDMTFANILSKSEPGSVLFQAAGADEFSRGIELISADVTISAESNVIFRADNINFLELLHDPYALSSFNDPLDYSSVGRPAHRPTILSTLDQTYSAFGHNINGNGIEITSEVPGYDIHFDTETLEFRSDQDLSVGANTLVHLISEYDTDIVSLRSVSIVGNGESSVTRNLVPSVYIKSGSDFATQEGSSISFYAKRDLWLTSFDELNAIVDSLELIANSENIILEAQDQLNQQVAGSAEINAASSVAINAANVRMTGDDLFSLQSINTRMYGLQDLFIESNGAIPNGDQPIGPPDVTFNAQILYLNAPVVDVSSTASLIFPRLNLNENNANPGQIFINNFNAYIPGLCFGSPNVANRGFCLPMFDRGLSEDTRPAKFLPGGSGGNLGSDKIELGNSNFWANRFNNLSPQTAPYRLPYPL